MATQQHPAITDEMRARIGVESAPRVSYPVDKSLIRIWAIAVAWPEPPDRLFWDEDYAGKTRYGGIIAPPYFNPFAFQIDEARMRAPVRDSTAERGGRPGGNAGGGAEYTGVPIRPGDVITSRSKVVDIIVRSGRSGETLYTVTETRWTNQRDDLVRVYRGSSFQLLGR
jgi:hypothetical protein